MNPLSAWTFNRRHMRQTALLLGLIALVTASLYLMGALVWAIFVEPGRLAYMALSEFSMVTPASSEPDPEMPAITLAKAHPDVARVLPTTTIRTELPGMMPGESFQFDLFGLLEKDIPYFLDRFDASLQEGSVPEAGTNGLLLSSNIAAMLGVRIGDIHEITSSEIYAGINIPLEATPFEVVGIVQSDEHLAIVSLEFLENHKLYQMFPDRFLVAAQEGREASVDDFLRNEIQARQTAVLTLSMLNERITKEALPGLLMLLPIVLVVTVAFSLVIVIVNYITNLKRLSEFGVLHAVGFSQHWLIGRLTKETTTQAVVGVVLGIGLAWAIVNVLRVGVFEPRGYALSFVAWIPILLTISIPTGIAGFTYLTVRKTLSRLDPVAIIEQGELSQEGAQKQAWRTSKSLSNPLSSATFFRRHRRRALLLIGGMSLVTVAVTLFIFALAVDADAREPFLGYLKQVSVVRNAGIAQSLDPKLVTKVEAHPAVEKVITVAPRNHILSAFVPPFTGAEASPFAVYSPDMECLIELYGLVLKEGHLPRPGTNEMIIPESLAQNRSLAIGDIVGNPDSPTHPGAPALPVEFVISGIFARPSATEDEYEIGFISLEFLEKYEPFTIPDVPPLIVVPKAGRKPVLDDWLETEVAGVDVSVLTHRQEVARLRENTRNQMLAMALLQGAIAIVAAIGLAVLNYVFTNQRQTEFGTLYALGFGRSQLVGRVLGETAFLTGIAWVLGATICLLGILFLRLVIFAPLGLSFNLFNITPWLYTLPIPVAVLIISTVTLAWTLLKLDPIAIIERKAR
jgi:ABC-type lipoprotein release transport system permease subunit